MKLLQLLTIGGVEYELAEDRVMLELSGIGRAQFTINTNGEPIDQKKQGGILSGLQSTRHTSTGVSWLC
jgi:hypothetical protein